MTGARQRHPWLLAALALGLAAGCAQTEPRLEDAPRMDAVVHGHTTIYYRSAELPRATAAALAPDVDDVRRRVGALLGLEPLRTEMLIYPAPGSTTARVPVQHTAADVRDGRVRFVHPLPQDDDPLGRDELLGTTAHEVAEATLLSKVTTLDPHVRWMHDGIAELAEHEVLRERAPDALRALLGRARRFVEEARARGVEWIDLTRWRQLPTWVIRSWRVVGDGVDENLSLDDIPASVARVAAARDRLSPDDPRRAPLEELLVLLERARTRAARPWRPDEARADDPRTRDYAFYVAAFALWLEAERERPGALSAFVAALSAHERAHDLVVTEEEVAADLGAALGHPVERLEHVTLEHIAEVLAAEAARLEGER